ncbi:methylenetetrahydrofolate--tRNA-(uracil(54)-C(5))-methyltransferase (FADH(2)-oxidizing) TrmFO [Candidatus Fermentibacteria bacterium]|nr:MAG: methylenetetrahydrofolate--tRNA-(uracil(54)-C(5))-methyltransferase (FADH(2)-oxidizing) TrmFO [Candidatus Fermentibacteria bacterium]
MKKVSVIGAGLAGSEAALQLASAGIGVQLYEMRPEKMTEAHSTGLPAELVCSNSLRSDRLWNAAGLLKEELRLCKSFLMKAADASRVPAGGALAVDRTLFSNTVRQMLREQPLIEIIQQEITELPCGRTIIAAGPLASPTLAGVIGKLTGSDSLYFYDAIAPVVSGESVNRDIAFVQDRYGEQGEGDYLNCPMTEDEYDRFLGALLGAERVVPRAFEKEVHFQGCMPVEAIADTGRMSLVFGPMKPVGITDPRSGKRPFAVVQLRMEDLSCSAWNLVGFQTKLTWPEQKRVFRLIPGLEKAEFLRLGSMHRNTYINGPELLDERLRLKNRKDVSFVGQITGVEGYIESIASGFLAGFLESGASVPPADTALGAILRYASNREAENFQPSNINFGLLPPLNRKVRGGRRAVREALASRALESIREWLLSQSGGVPLRQVP